MSHLLRYPNAISPTHLVTLLPSLVTVQEDTNVQAVQRVLPASDGTLWRFQLSTNRPQVYEMLVANLFEADWSGYSGYSTLRLFMHTVVNFSLLPFDLTHSDGGTVTVIMAEPHWQFSEGRKGFWSGRLPLQRVV